MRAARCAARPPWRSGRADPCVDERRRWRRPPRGQRVLPRQPAAPRRWLSPRQAAERRRAACWKVFPIWHRSAMDRVEIVEVSPRDGLQAEDVMVDTATKLELIRRAVDAGIRRIEV